MRKIIWVMALLISCFFIVDTVHAGSIAITSPVSGTIFPSKPATFTLSYTYSTNTDVTGYSCSAFDEAIGFIQNSGDCSSVQLTINTPGWHTIKMGLFEQVGEGFPILTFSLPTLIFVSQCSLDGSCDTAAGENCGNCEDCQLTGEALWSPTKNPVCSEQYNEKFICACNITDCVGKTNYVVTKTTIDDAVGGTHLEYVCSHGGICKNYLTNNLGIDLMVYSPNIYVVCEKGIDSKGYCNSAYYTISDKICDAALGENCYTSPLDCGCFSEGFAGSPLRCCYEPTTTMGLGGRIVSNERWINKCINSTVYWTGCGWACDNDGVIDGSESCFCRLDNPCSTDVRPFCNAIFTNDASLPLGAYGEAYCVRNEWGYPAPADDLCAPNLSGSCESPPSLWEKEDSGDLYCHSDCCKTMANSNGYGGVPGIAEGFCGSFRLGGNDYTEAAGLMTALFIRDPIFRCASYMSCIDADRRFECRNYAGQLVRAESLTNPGYFTSSEHDWGWWREPHGDDGDFYTYAQFPCQTYPSACWIMLPILAAGQKCDFSDEWTNDDICYSETCVNGICARTAHPPSVDYCDAAGVCYDASGNIVSAVDMYKCDADGNEILCGTWTVTATSGYFNEKGVSVYKQEGDWVCSNDVVDQAFTDGWYQSLPINFDTGFAEIIKIQWEYYKKPATSSFPVDVAISYATAYQPGAWSEPNSQSPTTVGSIMATGIIIKANLTSDVAGISPILDYLQIVTSPRLTNSFQEIGSLESKCMSTTKNFTCALAAADMSDADCASNEKLLCDYNAVIEDYDCHVVVGNFTFVRAMLNTTKYTENNYSDNEGYASMGNYCWNW